MAQVRIAFAKGRLKSYGPGMLLSRPLSALLALSGNLPSCGDYPKKLTSVVAESVALARLILDRVLRQL